MKKLITISKKINNKIMIKIINKQRNKMNNKMKKKLWNNIRTELSNNTRKKSINKMKKQLRKKMSKKMRQKIINKINLMLKLNNLPKNINIFVFQQRIAAFFSFNKFYVNVYNFKFLNNVKKKIKNHELIF